MAEEKKKALIDITPDIGAVVRRTTVERIYLGPDTPPGVVVSGTGNIEEAVLDLALGQQDIASRVVLLGDEKVEQLREEGKLTDEIQVDEDSESMTDDGN